MVKDAKAIFKKKNVPIGLDGIEREKKCNRTWDKDVTAWGDDIVDSIVVVGRDDDDVIESVRPNGIEREQRKEIDFKEETVGWRRQRRKEWIWEDTIVLMLLLLSLLLLLSWTPIWNN